MQTHSTTKRKRRPKSSKRVDWTAETLRKLKEHEQAEVIVGMIDMTAAEQRVLDYLSDKKVIPADDLDVYGTEEING